MLEMARPFEHPPNQNSNNVNKLIGRLNLFGPPMKSHPLTPDMKEAQQAIADTAGSNGTRFTEVMTGYIYAGDDIENFQVAADAAKGASSSASFLLSVDSYSTRNCILLHLQLKVFREC
jgi:hypothetical protein